MHLIGSRCSWVPLHSIVIHVWFSLTSLFSPFYFDLTFPVFFQSSVLIHPEHYTDFDNLDTMQHNLRHSAKGSNDVYDVPISFTGYEPTTRFSTSSSTPRVPSPTYPRHRIWT